MTYKTVYVQLFGVEIVMEVPCTSSTGKQELSNKAHKMLKDAVKGARFSVDHLV